MPTRSRRLVALALAGALALPTAGPRPGAGRAAAPAGAAGSWVGWARLTNDWPGQLCRYDAGTEATSVRLELAAGSDSLAGLGRDRPPGRAGLGLPPAAQALHDRRGRPRARGRCPSWTPAATSGRSRLRRGGTVLQGLLAWRQGGPSSRSPRASRARTGCVPPRGWPARSAPARRGHGGAGGARGGEAGAAAAEGAARGGA